MFCEPTTNLKYPLRSSRMWPWAMAHGSGCPPVITGVAARTAMLRVQRRGWRSTKLGGIFMVSMQLPHLRISSMTLTRYSPSMIESVYTNTRCSQAVPAGGSPYWAAHWLVVVILGCSGWWKPYWATTGLVGAIMGSQPWRARQQVHASHQTTGAILRIQDLSHIFPKPFHEAYQHQVPRCNSPTPVPQVWYQFDRHLLRHRLPKLSTLFRHELHRHNYLHQVIER